MTAVQLLIATITITHFAIYEISGNDCIFYPRRTRMHIPNKNHRNFVNCLSKTLETGKSDLVVLIDGSGSITRSGFEIAKKFVKALLSNVKIAYDATRIAVGTFSDNHQININYINNPSIHNHKCKFNEDFKKVPFEGNSDNVIGALEDAIRVVSAERRKSKPVVIMLTDGYGTYSGQYLSGYDVERQKAKELKQIPVTLYTVAVTTGESMNLMSDIASHQNAYLEVATFSDLQKLAESISVDPKDLDNNDVQVSDSFCNTCDQDAVCWCNVLSGKSKCVCKRRYYGTAVNTGKRTCFPSKCPTISKSSKYIGTSRLNCFDNQLNVGQYCEFQCHQGFNLTSKPTLKCESSLKNEPTGKWNEDLDKHPPTCEDIEQPEFDKQRKCDNGIQYIKNTLPGKDYAMVNFEFINVTDNSGEPPEVTCHVLEDNGTYGPCSYELGKEVPINITEKLEIRFKATDAANNSRVCKFQVTVKDIEKPTLIKCPKTRKLETYEASAVVTWDEAEYTDNSDLQPNVTSSVQSGSRFYLGKVVTVQYNATDQSGNINQECNFKIEIVKNTPGTLPTFTKGPDAAYGNRTGGFLRIFGCHVSSKVSLDGAQAYWLRNNFERIPVQIDRTEGEGNVLNYRFDAISKENGSNYTDHGFYQCLLVLPDSSHTQVLSKETVDVQFRDISTTSVAIRMNKQWNERLRDENSTEYKTLKEEVFSKLEDKLRKMNSNAVIRLLGFSSGSVIANTQILLLNVQPEERIKECENTKHINEQVKNIGTLDVLSVASKSLDCCTENTEGELSFKGQYNYSKSLESTIVASNCSYSKVKEATRRCEGNMKTGPRWSNVLLDNCPAKTKSTNDLIKLTKISICNSNSKPTTNCVSSLQVANNLSSVVNQNNSITTRQDILFIKTILRHITNAPSTFDEKQLNAVLQITNDVVATIGELVAADRKVVTQTEKYTQSASDILLLLDDFAKKLGEVVKKTKQPISISGKTIAFAIKYVDPGNVMVFTDKGQKDDVVIKIEERNYSQTEHNSKKSHLSSIAIPQEVFQTNSKIVHSFFYKLDTLFQTRNDLEQHSSPMVQSNILAVTVGGERTTNLTEPVIMKFRKIKEFELPNNVQSKSICTFWKFNESITGVWSTEGCRKMGESSEYVECQCDHLTNFAVLLDVSQIQGSTFELEVFTWIGCGISLAGLLATFMTLLVFPNTRKKLPQKILMFLTLSLLCLLIVFLAGVDGESSNSNRGCQVVAGLIQYFTLTSFFWMAIEAVNLYRNFVQIFYSGSEHKFLKNSCLIAWGTPMIFVVICGFLAEDKFGGERYCVVRGEVFYFGTLLPVAVILFGNMTALFLVMRSLRNRNPAMKTSKKTKEIRSQMRIAFACAVLLGLTWLFGLFAVGDLREVFQWLFTIFNSLQGLFIFIFHILRNKDASEEWKNVFCKSQRGNEGSSHSQTNTHSLPLKMKSRLNEAYST